MPEITSAEAATEKARVFIKKYRVIARPVKAVREDDTWTVEVDVGPVFTAIARVKIDARTGKVLEYDIPARAKA